MKKSVPGLLIVGLLAAVPAAGQITIPDIRVDFEQPTAEPVSLFCTPVGGGDAFDQARVWGGAVADATITITLLVNSTGTYEPVANFPYEDIWLMSMHGELTGCPALNPDSSTDENGRTRWHLPLRAGGHLDPAAGDALLVAVNGDAFLDGVTNFLRFNSADINGDGFVNLSDVSTFVADLYGPYRYRSDFVWDGTVNLSDAGRMSESLGHACP